MLGQRHRVQHARATASSWSAVSRDPDRRRRQRRRPLHPRPGRRSRHLGRGRAPGADVLLLPGRGLHAGDLPARRRLHLLARRRRALERADRSSPGRCRWPTSPRPRRARWSATTSRPRSTPPARRRPSFAIGIPHTGSVFDEGMWAPSAPLPVATAAGEPRRHQRRGRERPRRRRGPARRARRLTRSRGRGSHEASVTAGGLHRVPPMVAPDHSRAEVWRKDGALPVARATSCAACASSRSPSTGSSARSPSSCSSSRRSCSASRGWAADRRQARRRDRRRAALRHTREARPRRRRRTDPRQLEQHPTPTTRPGRQPSDQRRAAPRHRHPRPLSPADPRLHRTTTQRRQEHPRSDPLPQALPHPPRLATPPAAPSRTRTSPTPSIS